MITHPTKKESPSKFPSVDQAYAEAGLGAVGVIERDPQGLVQKMRKTHFNTSKSNNRSSYTPLTNTAANAFHEEMLKHFEEVTDAASYEEEKGR